MPPNGTTTKPVRAGAPGRGVVPVIPLPYMKPRGKHAKQSSGAALRPVTNGSSLKIQHDADDSVAPETATARATTNTNQPKTKTQTQTQTQNQAQNLAQSQAPAQVSEETVAVQEAASESSGEDKSATSVDLTPTPTHSTEATQATSVQAPEPVVSQTAQEPDLGQPVVPVVSEASSVRKAAAPGISVTFHRRASAEPSLIIASADHPVSVAPMARPPPVVSPSRYAMPPAFQPAPRPHGHFVNGDGVRGPRPGMNGPNMHHPHPSNGSLQFGGFGSNSSSPAPPHSAGFGPPPGLPGPHDGRRGFHGHAAPAHGFPPMMPYGTEFVPVTSTDGYGRPVPAPAPVDTFAPHVNNFGPPTPHSFQESHSPNPHDEAGGYAHFPGPPPGLNSAVANGEDRRQHPHHHHQQQRSVHGFQGPPPQRMMHPHMPPPHMMHHRQENQDEGLAGFLQAQFQDVAFTDCVLELRYTDDRASPVRLPSHRLVLARSVTLRGLMESNKSGHANPLDAANRTIVLQSDDRYLRSDAFWMAVQRLYAFPLLEIPEPAAMGEEGLMMAGSADNRFDFALGYAVAGHLIGWTPVVVRGFDIASRQLTWTTLEKALTFALGDMPGRASADRHAPFAYGEVVQILMEGIVSFIVNHFPAFFRLDTSVADAEGFARIPPVPAAKQTNGPAIARGTSVHLGQGRRARPMHIKFGDMNNSGAGQDSNGADAPLNAQQRAMNTILSRVLLNLPFAYLKPVLESAGFSASDWAGSEMRHQIMLSVVSEREARRLRALDAVREGKVSHAGQIRHSLESMEPRHGTDAWHVLGWQEEAVPYTGEAPSLARKWIPLQYPGNETGKPAPAQASYP